MLKGLSTKRLAFGLKVFSRRLNAGDGLDRELDLTESVVQCIGDRRVQRAVFPIDGLEPIAERLVLGLIEHEDHMSDDLLGILKSHGEGIRRREVKS